MYVITYRIDYINNIKTYEKILTSLLCKKKNINDQFIDSHVNKYNEVLKIIYDNDNNIGFTELLFKNILENIEQHWIKILDFRIIDKNMWAHFLLKIIIKTCLNKTENTLKDINDINDDSSPLENSKFFIENYKYNSSLIEDISNYVEKILLVINIIDSTTKLPPKIKIKKNVFNLIELLTIRGILTEKIIKQKVKTIKLKKINFEGINKNKYFELEYYEQPFHLIMNNNILFLVNSYIFSLKFAIKTNKYNSNNIKIKNFTFLQNTLLVPYYVEIDLLFKVKDEIILTTEFNNWETILSGQELEKLKRINEDSLVLEEDFKNAKEKFDEIKKNYTDTHKDIYTKYKKAENAYKNIQRNYNKKYSILITLNIFHKFFEELNNRKSPFYLASYIDFRGRVYIDSKISPTSSRTFRHLYHYGYYSNTELHFNKIKLQNSKAFNIIYKYKEQLIVLEKNILERLNLIKINILLWLILELGKINKKKIMKDGFVELKDFILNGCEIFLKKEIPIDFEEKIIYLKITKAIDDILLNKKIKKTIIYKDSTASVLQHLTKILGHKSEKILEIMNINNNDRWSDTYTHIINLYIIRYPIKDDIIRSLFNRKNLKKLIMTIHFSLTYKSAINYFFLESNNEIKNIYTQKLDSDEFNKKIIFEVKKFYNFLKNDIETGELYERSSKELIKSWSEGKKIITKDNIELSLDYKKLIKKSLETNVEGKRKSTINYSISENYDKRKTNVALRANLVHSMDSTFARSILSVEKIISIHDSFGISIAETPFIIDLANIIFIEDSFKEKIIQHNKVLNKTFSIFLLL